MLSPFIAFMFDCLRDLVEILPLTQWKNVAVRGNIALCM